MRSLVLTFFMMMSVTAPASTLVCADVFADDLRAELSEPGRKLFVALTYMPYLLAPDRVRWENFNNAKLLKTEFAAYAKHLETLSPEARANERRQLLRAFSQHHVLQKAFEALATPKSGEYLPGQYGIHRAHLKGVIEALRELPPDFRPAVARLKPDLKNVDPNPAAVELLSKHRQTFRRVFPVTGFKNYKAYETALRASEDPLVKRAIELIDGDQIQVGMRRPEGGRFWIPKTGFQSQHATGSSRGLMDPNRRDLVESHMLGEPPSDYAARSPDLKPKYATLMVKEGNGLGNYHAIVDHYGPDVYLFKTKEIADRMTFFMGDSLNQLVLGRITMNGQPKNIDEMMIPWSKRLLMVPYMVENLAQGYFGRPSSPSSLAPEITPKMKMYYTHDYWEAQIFGRVDLDMVEAFRFEKTPPEGEFLTELRRRGIKIYDARTSEVVEWQEVAP